MEGGWDSELDQRARFGRIGGIFMRAYRPGRMSDEDDEDFQGRRDDNIELYTWRARHGLPLFETPGRPEHMSKLVACLAELSEVS